MAFVTLSSVVIATTKSNNNKVCLKLLSDDCFPKQQGQSTKQHSEWCQSAQRNSPHWNSTSNLTVAIQNDVQHSEAQNN